ncbi:MAG: 30S ribosomal protein S19e [archaeon]|nr:30S ribosomal protein S19e [archaeon]MCP8305827.1 30S ribosomal protein S19e [archaeon]
MVTVYDIPQDLLIKKLAEELKRRYPQVSPPAWAMYVKTGSHAERQPQDKDWWYTRCASLLRKVYLHGPIGLSDLKPMYGGRKSVGYRPFHHRDGGGSVIRKALKQLEASGLVTKQEEKGHILTGQGRALLDRLSTEIFKEIVEVNPSLARYA